jgi:hypothetical protein
VILEYLVILSASYQLGKFWVIKGDPVLSIRSGQTKMRLKTFGLGDASAHKITDSGLRYVESGRCFSVPGSEK